MLARCLTLLLVLASSCAATRRLAPTETGLRGTLVIAGGGMSQRSVRVREAFLARRLLGPVGVIGAASSDPEESARRGVFALNETMGGQLAVALPFDSAEPDLAHDPAAVAMIEACGALWFTGGSQSRIVEAMRPGGVDSPAWLACEELLARDGVIGGSSAGAAMMSDPMIQRGRSANAVVFGVGTEGVELGEGMGFFPWGLVGQHFLERGRFGRMVVALTETRERFGWGISEDSALLVDRATGWVEVVGPEGLTLFDMSGLLVSEGRWDGVGLSLLGDGDRVNARTGEVVPAAGAVPLTPEASSARELVVEELFTETALRDAIHQLSRTNCERVRLRGVEACALLREGSAARAWCPGGSSSAGFTSAHGLQLDLYRVTD